MDPRFSLDPPDYCNLHDRVSCTLCDECHHEAALHLNAHPDQDNIPAIFDHATCWSENLCLACVRETCATCGRPRSFGSGDPACAEQHPMDALYPLRVSMTPPEDAVIARAVREDDWAPGLDTEVALACVLICDACGEPADVRDPVVRAFHAEEVLT